MKQLLLPRCYIWLLPHCQSCLLLLKMPNPVILTTRILTLNSLPDRSIFPPHSTSYIFGRRNSIMKLRYVMSCLSLIKLFNLIQFVSLPTILFLKVLFSLNTPKDRLLVCDILNLKSNHTIKSITLSCPSRGFSNLCTIYFTASCVI